jgi:hypothetical protein
MLNEEVTKVEIKKIVNDEVRKIVADELNKQLKTSLKSGSGKEEMNAAIKAALNNLYKFMWSKRNVWNNELK